ncbi:hypothetical protein LPJ53_003662 [Coemansia erecta]|uniref:Uncharacterized protein n=1 Tax=Coemansia erecta TaxID=147472 RepID=A0A9W8CSH8_9FUNG|nr:hypothetical protein LPJ53_003662 [Coemansia erecta]
MHSALSDGDIVRRVLATFYATGWEAEHGRAELNYMRGLHPLAAVSRRWRSLAVYHFHARALTLEVRRPATRGRLARLHRQVFAQPTLQILGPLGYVHSHVARCAYLTNAHMLGRPLQSGGSQRTAALTLFLGTGVTADDLASSLRCIGFFGRQWPQLRTLHIVTGRMYAASAAENAQAVGRPLYASLADVGRVLDALFAHAPAIDAVRLASRARLAYCEQLPLQAAVVERAPRLRALEISSHFPSYSLPPMLPPLARLALSPAHALRGHVLAHIDASALRALRLYNLRPAHFFAAAGATPARPALFPELRALALFFAAAPADAARDADWPARQAAPAAVFPLLRAATVHSSGPSVAAVVRALAAAPLLESLHVSAPSWVLAEAGIGGLRRLRRLHVAVDQPDRDEPLTDDAFFAGLLRRLDRLVSLVVRTCGLTVGVLLGHRLACTALRVLDVDLTLKYEQVAAVLRQLPRLVLFRCVVSVASMRTEPVDATLGREMAPCSLTVQKMAVAFDQHMPADDPLLAAALANILCLLAAVPSLLVLRMACPATVFRTHVRRALANRAFARHAAHLRAVRYEARADVRHVGL